jgi:hypothetical protein
VGVSGSVCFAAACTLGALESACAGTLDGPDESGPRGEKTSTIAFSMELPTSTIEFFVSTAAFAGIASASDVASDVSISFLTRTRIWKGVTERGRVSKIISY